MRGSALVAAMVLTASAAAAQQAAPVPPAKASPASQKPVKASAKRGAPMPARSVISGTVVDVNGQPVPNATVNLRSLQLNKVEQSVTAGRTGQYTFVVQPDLPYVIEIADQTGRVIAVSDVLIPQTGEVAAALVKIPARLPTIAGVFGETAGSIISATAGTGITAIQSSIPDPPLSPER